MHPFRSAIEAGDFDALPQLFADDVVFRSPIAHRPYHGRRTVTAILWAVTQVLEDFRYQREIGATDASDHALTFTAKVDDLVINGCDFLHTGTDGLIDEFTVMLRPLKAVLAFSQKMRSQFEAAMADMAMEVGE